MDPSYISRRWFLEQCGIGLGAAALTAMGATDSNPLAPRQPHFAPKAKRVICLFMAGGPSQLELFDYKPQLAKFDGTLPPADLLKGYRAAFINPNSKLLGPKFQFAKHGQSGAEISELIPHTDKFDGYGALFREDFRNGASHASCDLMLLCGDDGAGRLGKPDDRIAVDGLYGMKVHDHGIDAFVAELRGVFVEEFRLVAQLENKITAFATGQITESRGLVR